MKQHTKTLDALIKANRWRRGAEIGVRRANTTSALLGLNPGLHMYAVDPWEAMTLDGQVYTPDKVASFERDARAALAPFGGRCLILKARSVDGARLVADRSLDFVFIDGDHTAQGVYDDVMAWTPKLRPGGVLTGHDINWPSVREGLTRAIGPTWATHPGDVWTALPGPTEPVHGLCGCGRPIHYTPEPACYGSRRPG